MQEPQACAAWALLLPDAAEGLLSEAEQGALDRHVAGCVSCARELSDAQRGAAWLGLLKAHTPEPPSHLLHNILAKTTGAEHSLPIAASVQLVAQPRAWAAASMGLSADDRYAPTGARISSTTRLLAAWTERLDRWFGSSSVYGYGGGLHPRLAMTSAMAFFSICLTLNLLGSSLHSLHTASLRPAGLQRTVADTSASLVRSFEGIRMVYRVESRVNEWRTASSTQEEAPLETVQ